MKSGCGWEGCRPPRSGSGRGVGRSGISFGRDRRVNRAATVPPVNVTSTGPNRIQLYSIELWLDDPRAFEGVLSNPERERAAGFTHVDSRRRYVAGRVAVRQILGKRLGLSPERVPLSSGVHGKPELVPGFCGPAFNLSHSGDRALLAVGPAEVGVDLESASRKVDAMGIVRSFFSPAERAGFEGLPPGLDRDALFLNVWTRKEAVVKAIGKGLACSLSSFELPIGPLPSSGLVMKCPVEAGRRWRLFDVPNDGVLGAAWVAAVAGCEPVDGLDPVLRHSLV